MITEEKFKETVRRYRMLVPGDRVVVGISGGADSTTLAHLLWRFREEFGITLHLAHLNHGLRGREADEDQALVEAYAARFGIPLTVKKVAVGELAEREGLSVEDAGRQTRYRFFAETAEKVGARRIAVAHTADDTVETVLMWLLRGSGLRGLGGIPPVRGEKIIRPLTGITRSEVEEYCRENGLTFAVDKTNLSGVYLRNRIRLDLLPRLEKEYNPRLRERLWETAEILRQEEDFLEDMAAAEEAGVVVSAREGETCLDGERLARLHPAMQRRILRRAITGMTGKEPGFRKVEETRRLLAEKSAGRRISLPGRATARWRYGTLVLENGSGKGRLEPFAAGRDTGVPVKVEGKTLIPGSGWTLKASLLPAEAPLETVRHLHAPWEVMLDWDKIEPPLVIRYRREGDYFYPLGLGSGKKLKEYFIDARIPREERDRIPLLTDQGKILWVIPSRIDERVRVSSQTHTILHLQVVHIPADMV